MTRYISTMTEALQEIREGFSSKQIKMAIGIASDKRYAGGNMTGAVNAIEKIKRGLSDHPQVAAVLKRQNEDIQEDGHTDVASAKNQVKVAMTALQKMEMELGKLNDEDSLPSWWTNKVAVAVDKLDGMADYLDTQVEEVELDEGKMKQFHMMQTDGKSAEEIAKALKLDLKTVKDLMKEEVELDEMKMDDPKLVKTFDKLKRGDTVKLKTSSTISKGTDFVDYVVKSKNTVNKGRVEKITLATKGNEGTVKKFLYKRDGKVTFAIGDMGASIDDIKEETLRELEEGKSSTGYELYHKDFSSAMAHAYDFAKKKFGIEVDPKEIDDKVASGPRKPSKGNTNSYRLKGKDGKKAIQVQVYGMDNGKYELNMYKEETMKEAALSIAEKLKVSDGLGAWITDFQKSDAPQFASKSDEDKKKMAIAAFVDAGGKLDEMAYKPGSPKVKDIRPQEKAAKALDALIKSGGLDKSDFQKARAMYVQASDMQSRRKLKDFISNLDTEPLEAILDIIGRNDPDTFQKMYPNSKPGEYLSTIAYKHRNAKNEETELDERAPKMKYALVGTDMKIYSMGSDERDLRLDRRSLEQRFKDVAPLKMARLKTAQSIGDKVDKSQLKEEEEPNKPDTAKAVDQGRDDKKKTRIAQLQLQIAKASETINKLNSQEKPDA